MQDTCTVQQKAKLSHFRSSRFSLKVSLVCNLITLFLLSAAGTAHSQDNALKSLTLSCSIHSDNYGLDEGLLATKEATLTGSSLSEGGRKLVYKNNHLEFWVLTHMTQKLGNDHFINNFEVAIRNLNNGRFYNALSDSVFSPDRAPNSARIRMATYYPDSFREESYVMFECRSGQDQH